MTVCTKDRSCAKVTVIQPRRCSGSERWRRTCRPPPGWLCWWVCRLRGPTLCPRGWTVGSSASGCDLRCAAGSRCTSESGEAPLGRRGRRSAAARPGTGRRCLQGRGCCAAESIWEGQLRGLITVICIVNFYLCNTGQKIYLVNHLHENKRSCEHFRF